MGYLGPVRARKVRDLLRLLRERGCTEVRQRGSHRIWRCGACQTTIPGRDGETVPTGTLRSIQRHLAPCLGQKWLEEDA